MTSDSQKSSASAVSSSSSTNAQKRVVRYVLPANAMIGPYRIEKALGRGGMGEVYLARHVKLNIFRAIKILLPFIAERDPVCAERFMNEARLAIDIRHQNIINVMDANYDDRYGIYYIVMEYVDGSSIRKIIKAKGRFDEQTALKIVLHVAEALQAAEKIKIVHRDIKPDNIMMTTDGEVKLADLGIAKSNSGNENVELTNPQMMLGTIAYVSPEQATDAQSVDSRADIYSLGVTLYEMLTAEKPYTGSQVEILQQLFNAPVPNVQAKAPSVSHLTAKLLKKMMAKDKTERPRNFETLCRLLKKLIVGQDSGNQEFLQQAREMDVQQLKIQEERRRISEERKRLSEEQNLIEEAKKKISSHDRKFSEERKKVSEERERLSEEQSLIEEEKKKISDHRKLFSAERKHIERERKRIEDERRRMLEQQQKISEKEHRISAEVLRLQEERRQKRKKQIKAFFIAIYHGISGSTARRIYKILLVISIVAAFGSLIYYLCQIGVITKARVQEAVVWLENKLTPEEMRKGKNDGPEKVTDGKCVVTFMPLASQEVLSWLGKNNQVKIKRNGADPVVIPLPGKITLPEGDYDVAVEIPGCQTVNRQFSLQGDRDVRIDVPVIPAPGKIKINSDIKDFEILYQGEWVAKKSFDIPALIPYDLIVRAKGYQCRVYRNIVLTPNQTKNISVRCLPITGNKQDLYMTANISAAIDAFNRGTKESYAKALKLFVAEKENPVAAYYLGMIYESGLGMDYGWSNSRDAAKWYKIAVRYDIPGAVYKMGLNYEGNGRYDEAFDFFMKGVELEHIPCFKKVGEYYFYGTGSIDKNLSQAYHYLLLPGKTGDSEAQLLLGMICESEDLVLRDLQQAKHWYEDSAKNGNAKAKIFLEQVKKTMEKL